MPIILPQASSHAFGIDAVFWAIHVVAIVMTVAIFGAILFLAVRYRQGSQVSRKLPEHEGMALELTWTIIPLIILIALFVWSTVVYFSVIRPPVGAMEVSVVGKQWMWKIKQPNGRWEMNELHLPLGRPVKLTMISEDVVHDFGIPAFRVKMDVIPGRYTSMWFQPTRVGQYHLFCSQFCGVNHAIMGGYIYVMEPAAYERWLNTGNGTDTMAAAGERLFRSLGCTGCHGGSSNVRAPTLDGIFNNPVAVQVPDEYPGTPVDKIPAKTINADLRYIHDSIILPEKEVVGGYRPIMPSYKGKVTEEQVAQLIDYIKSLGTSNGTSNGGAKSYNTNDAYTKDAAKAFSGLQPAQGNIDMSNPASRDQVMAGESARPGGGTPDMSNPVSRDRVFDANRGYNARNERKHP